MTLEQLKMKKRLLGLTAAELAEGAGVPLPTLQKILSGQTARPRSSTMEKLENFLKQAMTSASSAAYQSGSMKPSIFSDDTSSGSPADGSYSFIGEPGALYYSESKYPRQGSYTVDELCEIMERTPEGIRLELIDGIIYEISAPTVPHEIIVSTLHDLLTECINRQALNCLILHNAALLPLPEENTYLIPDIMVVCGREQLTKRWAFGGPVFIAEVLSPSTRTHDLIRKRRKYRAAGVRCLWLIDPEDQVVYADYARERPEKPAAETSTSDTEDINSEEGKASKGEEQISHTSYNTEIYAFDEIIPVRTGAHSCDIDFSKIRDRISWFFP